MNRRSGTVRALALAAAVLVVLGACSSGSSGKRAEEKEVPLKIGVLFTTSGKGGDLAQAVLGASKLAVDDATKDKVKVEIVQADYAGDPNLMAKAVADLKAGSNAIVVATDDPGVLPALESVTDIPIIHTLLGSGVDTERENVFSVTPTAAQQATRLVDYLATVRKYKRISLLTDSTPFGEEGRAAVIAAMSSEGISPVATLRFDPGADIHTPVASAGQRDSEALIVWVDSPGEASRIVVETQKMGFAYQIALSGNLATSTFAKNASAQVTPVAFRDGMLSVGIWAGPWFNLSRIISFFERFQADNSAQAPVQALSVYDAVAVLARAARVRSSATASDLVAGLEDTKDFEAAGVPITFGPNDHIGLDDDDLAIYGYTKDQDSAGGSFFPDVDTGGGFFTIVSESLRLPERYRFLTTRT